MHSRFLHRLNVVLYYIPNCPIAKQPRQQGGAHGGRAPAKIVRAPAKITVD